MHEFEGEWKTRCGAPAKVISSVELHDGEILYFGVITMEKENISSYWNNLGNNLFTKYDLIERVRDLRLVR